VPFVLHRSGDDLSVEVGDDTCGADDVMVETAIYEASQFHLIQAADWEPPAWSSTPHPSPLPPRAASTSGSRQIPHPIGSVDGASLGYLEYLPPAYSETGDKSPLILFLHGSGESGDGGPLGVARLSAAGIPSLIASDSWPDDRPFVVLSAQHDDSKPPSYCMESSEIDDFLHFALSHYNVDPSRIYVTGLSCGAIGLWNYLNEHGDELVAAAVPIAGNGLFAIDARGCDLGTLPIWAFHGGYDDSVPIETETYPLEKLHECTDPSPVDARLTVFPSSGHDVWTRTYRGSDGYDIYDWMLSHHK
jgi:predicted peptidase